MNTFWVYVAKPGYSFMTIEMSQEGVGGVGGVGEEFGLILKKTPRSRKGKTITILVPPSKIYGYKLCIRTLYQPNFVLREKLPRMEKNSKQN